MPKKGTRTGKYRLCLLCSREYYVFPSMIKRGYGPYCSGLCRLKAEGVAKKKCLICGKELKRTTGCKNGKFCSYACFGKSIQTKKSILCDFCGKEFSRRVSQLNRVKNGSFCSRVCCDNFQRRNKKEFTCMVCGKSFYRRGNRKYKYCSSVCNMHSQQIKRGPNKLELAGREIIKELNVEFVEQKLLFEKFTVDVYLDRYKLVIQWDGDFWHGNPKKYKVPNHIQKSNRNFDRACNAYLRKCGIRVLRFWESDVKSTPSGVLDEIKPVLQGSVL